MTEPNGDPTEMTSTVSNDALRDACAAWQDGRDGGSSPVRAAARVLTGTKHYFEASFIDRYEREASANALTMARARSLLDGLATSVTRDGAGWAAQTGFGSGWVGRGIASAPQDAEIDASLDTGFITMPLWGLSLDRDVALSYGSRFLFEIEGPFPAIPAWEASGLKADERELIAGGRYAVSGVTRAPEGAVVTLRFLELVRPCLAAS